VQKIVSLVGIYLSTVASSISDHHSSNKVESNAPENWECDTIYHSEANRGGTFLIDHTDMTYEKHSTMKVTTAAKF